MGEASAPRGQLRKSERLYPGPGASYRRDVAPRWSPGDVVVLRELWRGRIWAARPAVVVEDTPQRLAFHIPTGTTFKAAATPDGRWLRLPEDAWVLRDQTWDAYRILSFSWPDRAHGVLLYFDAEDRLAGWYVNLEEPLRRTPIGFDTTDLVLDLEVRPDRSWSWKDEDELAECLRRSLFTPEEAARIRAEGERAARRIEAGEPPFDGSWSDWRPDPAWPVPTLPPGWDRPS